MQPYFKGTSDPEIAIYRLVIYHIIYAKDGKEYKQASILMSSAILIQFYNCAKVILSDRLGRE